MLTVKISDDERTTISNIRRNYHRGLISLKECTREIRCMLNITQDAADDITFSDRSPQSVDMHLDDNNEICAVVNY